MSVTSLARPAVPPRPRRLVIAALVVLMTLATGAAVLGAGWTAASWTAVLVGVAGAAEASAVLLLVRARRLLPFLVPLLLVVTVVVPNLAGLPVPPHSTALTSAGQFASAAVTGLLGNEPWAFNVALGTLLWACGAWAAEVALSGRRGALATAPCWAVLAVNVINSPSPDHAVVASSSAAVLALLVIAAAQLERLHSRWQGDSLPVLPGTTSRFAVAGTAAGALILLLASVVPPLTSTDVSGRVFNFGPGGGGAGEGGSGAGGVGRAGTVRFDAATVPGGALTLAGTPVLTYRSSAPGGAYLRMATDGIFNSGNWLPVSASEGDLATATSSAGALDRERSAASGAVSLDVQPVTADILVSNDTSGGNLLAFAGEPDGASVSARASGLRSPQSRGGLLTVDSVAALSPITGRSLTTRATQSTATAAQLRTAGTAYPGFVSASFLDVPDDGSGGVPLIQALAEQWTRNATNPYDRATAVEAMLRNTSVFHYSLNPPLPNPVDQVWPITYFLTTSHTGYCQYFASSMGTMLRALGIPARLVNGYGPGTTATSTVRSSAGATWQVSSNDAHTWVEAYFPTYGWIPFEPTPPSVAGDYETIPRGGAGTVGSATASAPPTPGVSGTTGRRTPRPESAGAAGQQGGGGTRSAPFTVLLVSASAAVLLVLLFGVWLALPRGMAGTWRRIGLLGRLAGVRREPSATLQDFAQRVAPLLSSETQREALREIATLSDRTLYARTAPADDVQRMVRAWRQLGRAVPGVGWSALRRSAAP